MYLFGLSIMQVCFAKINPVAIYLRIFVLSIMQVCFANMNPAAINPVFCIAFASFPAVQTLVLLQSASMSQSPPVVSLFASKFFALMAL